MCSYTHKLLQKVLHKSAILTHLCLPRSDGHQSGGSGGHHSSGGSGGHPSSLGGGGGGGARAASVKGGSGGSDRRSIAGSVGSAGSEGGIIKQLGLYVRVKSDSGKKLSDQEILQQIKVGEFPCDFDLKCFVLLDIIQVLTVDSNIVLLCAGHS